MAMLEREKDLAVYVAMRFILPWTVIPNAANRSNRSINPRHIFINVSEGCLVVCLLVVVASCRDVHAHRRNARGVEGEGERKERLRGGGREKIEGYTHEGGRKGKKGGADQHSHIVGIVSGSRLAMTISLTPIFLEFSL